MGLLHGDHGLMFPYMYESHWVEWFQRHHPQQDSNLLQLKSSKGSHRFSYFPKSFVFRIPSVDQIADVPVTPPPSLFSVLVFHRSFCTCLKRKPCFLLKRSEYVTCINAHVRRLHQHTRVCVCECARMSQDCDLARLKLTYKRREYVTYLMVRRPRENIYLGYRQWVGC